MAESTLPVAALATLLAQPDNNNIPAHAPTVPRNKAGAISLLMESQRKKRKERPNEFKFFIPNYRKPEDPKLGARFLSRRWLIKLSATNHGLRSKTFVRSAPYSLSSAGSTNLVLPRPSISCYPMREQEVASDRIRLFWDDSDKSTLGRTRSRQFKFTYSPQFKNLRIQ